MRIGYRQSCEPSDNPPDFITAGPSNLRIVSFINRFGNCFNQLLFLTAIAHLIKKLFKLVLPLGRIKVIELGSQLLSQQEKLLVVIVSGLVLLEKDADVVSEDFMEEFGLGS